MRPPPRSRQEIRLAPAVALLREVGRGEQAAARSAVCDVLDAASARIAGFDLDGFRATLVPEPRLDAASADGWAAALLDLVAASGVPARLALATLAQPGVTGMRRRTTGAYYTDYRLARYLAHRTAALAALTARSTVVDPAAGTGVLLVALAERICGADRGAARDLVGDGLNAVDVDPACRRGTIAALATLTGDLAAISRMATRVRTADSLVAGAEFWCGFAADGRFDAVIGNPPWERLRTTRHETLRAAGSLRHYGADYESTGHASPGHPSPGHPSPGCLDVDADGADDERLRRYVAGLARRYPLLDDRQLDLSHAFLALSTALLRPGGCLGMLVPAGLIRSHGTRGLRERLFGDAAEVDITVLHNRSRFFGIDARFKFLAACARLRSGATGAGGGTLRLRQAGASLPSDPAPVPIRLADLAAARADLTVPEVADEAQWRLFRHLVGRGCRPDAPESPWAMRIVREVDMTVQRPLFRRERGAGTIPVVEGRMVGQYRSGAKTYVGGTGRAATWRPLPPGAAPEAGAQFFVDPARLPGTARDRIGRARIGFCDIVGQTNERTLQAALIPPGRVCGNKVPTIDFTGPATAGAPTREMLFLVAANSLVVDWFLRRVVTTSLNYFILRGLPLPPLDPDDATGQRLVALAECLTSADGGGGGVARHVARWRAEADVAMCHAYGIEAAELRLLLADFPLLDRGQPALPGEPRSTVTADLVLGTGGDGVAWERYLAATERGALAYVPREFAAVTR